MLSDKQRGLVPAVAEVFPDVPHAWYQAHYLNNAAAGVAEATEQMKVALRKDVRERVGSLEGAPPAQLGVATLAEWRRLVDHWSLA